MKNSYFDIYKYYLKKKKIIGVRNVGCLSPNIKVIGGNHLGGGSVVRVWDQEVCSLCGFRFKPCGCSYDGHWRLT